jgi:Spy/CpxP family protein refolding chaperone
MRKTTLTLALALVAATPLLAAPRGYGKPGHPGFRHDPEAFATRFEQRADRLAEALKLTDEQRQAVARLHEDARTETRARGERMRALHEELRAELAREGADATAVGAKMLELQELRTALRAARAQLHAEIGNLLTAEQRFAWEAMRELRGERLGRFGGPGGRRGPGPGRWSPPAD